MRATNLILHCGANPVDRGQLALVATPERTKSWVPIPHTRLLDGVQECLNRSGLSVVTEAHGLTRSGSRYFGLLQVTDTASGNGSADDFGLVVGVRNSHDQSFPAGLAIGASVFVCDNLSFQGEIKLARKHTSQIVRDLPQLIERACGLLGDQRRTQTQRFAAYKQHELSDGQARDLILQALETRALPLNKVLPALREWQEPRHREFREGGRTAWRLYNAVTECLKHSDLGLLPKRSQALHGIIDATCGLLVPAVAPAVAAAPEITQAV